MNCPISYLTTYTKIDDNKDMNPCEQWRPVALAFVPNPQQLPEVNHIDGIKTHCQSGNLEWRTHAGNMQHAAHNNLQADGVSFDKARNRWRVSYRAGGQNRFIGRYRTYEQALAARQQACLAASVII